jgi:hypothetical protein
MSGQGVDGSSGLAKRTRLNPVSTGKSRPRPNANRVSKLQRQSTPAIDVPQYGPAAATGANASGDSISMRNGACDGHTAAKT